MSVSGGDLLRRRWMVIVAAFVVAITGFGVYRLHGIFGSNDVVSWPRAECLSASAEDGGEWAAVVWQVGGEAGGDGFEAGRVAGLRCGHDL